LEENIEKKVQKGRCEMRQLPKCTDILKANDAVQYEFTDYLAL